MAKKPITCKKINALIKDEDMASREYYKIGNALIDNRSKQNGDMFGDMASDERGHKTNLIRLKEELCKK